MPPLQSLLITERSPEFERLRMNRKVMGAMRYGLMNGDPEKSRYDRTSDMMKRLKKYMVDRNAEHLVDIANLAELEFVEGDHFGVIPQDDSEHTEII